MDLIAGLIVWAVCAAIIHANHQPRVRVVARVQDWRYMR